MTDYLDGNSSNSHSGGDEPQSNRVSEDLARRRMRNRYYAQQSRQRKRQLVKQLEEQVQFLERQNAMLLQRMRQLEMENATLISVNNASASGGRIPFESSPACQDSSSPSPASRDVVFTKQDYTEEQRMDMGVSQGSERDAMLLMGLSQGGDDRDQPSASFEDSDINYQLDQPEMCEYWPAFSDNGLSSLSNSSSGNGLMSRSLGVSGQQHHIASGAFCGSSEHYYAHSYPIMNAYAIEAQEPIYDLDNSFERNW